MLRITWEETESAIRCKLAGKLVGPWVEEFAETWCERQTARGDRKVEVDLCEVTFVDQAGQRLLHVLHEQGVKLRACRPLTSELVRAAESRKRTPLAALVALSLMSAIAPARAADNTAATAAMIAPEKTPVRLTLQGAVVRALKSNPNVQISNLNTAQSQQTANIARSELLPQVGLRIGDSVSRINTTTAFGQRIPFAPEAIGPFNVVQAGPTFSTPIFDLTLFRRYQSAKANISVAEAQADTTREQYAALVTSQYLGVLRSSAELEASQSRLNLAEALARQATDLQKAGVGTGLDTLRANVQVQNERQRLINAQTQRKTALFGLARLLNLDPDTPIELEDETSFFETPAPKLEASLEAAYGQRPELKMIVSRLRAAEFDKKAAQAERLPRIAVTGGYAYQGLQPNSAIPTYQFQAGVELPLFTGGRIKAETARAELEQEKVRREGEDIRNRIAVEVRTAAAQLDDARNEVEVARQGVALAQEEVSQSRDRFQAGVANNIEIVTAQDALSRANDNQIAALYRYNQARADLARAMGQIADTYATK